MALGAFHPKCGSMRIFVFAGLAAGSRRRLLRPSAGSSGSHVINQFQQAVAHAAGQPDTVICDTVDGICSFEVLRTDRVVLWGWRADACVLSREIHLECRLSGG